MADTFLEKVARVLEEAARHLDEVEAEKLASIRAAKDDTLKGLASQYSELTGEDLPSDVLDKLASSDDDVLSVVHRMVEKTASENVLSLGGSSNRGTEPGPRTKKAALQESWERFGNWAVND